MLRLPATFGLLGILAAACAPGADADTAMTAGEADLTAAMAVPGVDESALDRSIDPCTDFYAFACGTYNASLPADTDSNTRAFSLLTDAQVPVLARVFQRLHDAPRSDAEKKASVLYTTCLANESFVLQPSSLHDRRLAIRAAKTPADLGTLLGQETRRGGYSLFRVDTAAQGSTVHLEATTNLVYPAGIDFTTDDGVAQFVTQRTALILAREPDLDPAEAKSLAEGAGRFLHNAAMAMKTLPRTAAPAAPVGRAGLATTAPHVDWDAYFAAIGSPSPPADFLVDRRERMAAIDQAIAASALDDVTAYLAAFEYRDAAAPSTLSHAARCQRRVSSQMSDAVEAVFLEEAGVDDAARAKTAALWKAIRTTFAAELEEEPFLDAATRAQALAKLNAMGQVLVSSVNHDTYADFAVDASDDFMLASDRLNEHDYDRGLTELGHAPSRLDLIEPVDDVNAAYDPELNKIDVPAGILGGYFFSAQAPDLANFAAIGAVLGHELTHGFDNRGRRYDAAGNERDWWTPASATAFDARAARMSTEYGAFAVDNVANADGSPAHVNGQLTLGENIADNGGLKTAFRASNVATSTAPVVAGFTPVQQFFVGFAQLWCGKDSTAHAKRLLQNDPHSPSKARVNVTLSNFTQFSDAFQCKTGSAMIPATRCEVW